MNEFCTMSLLEIPLAYNPSAASARTMNSPSKSLFYVRPPLLGRTTSSFSSFVDFSTAPTELFFIGSDVGFLFGVSLSSLNLAEQEHCKSALSCVRSIVSSAHSLSTCATSVNSAKLSNSRCSVGTRPQQPLQRRPRIVSMTLRVSYPCSSTRCESTRFSQMSYSFVR